MAFSETAGDEQVARALYIKLRVAQLVEEAELAAEKAALAAAEEAAAAQQAEKEAKEKARKQLRERQAAKHARENAKHARENRIAGWVCIAIGVVFVSFFFVAGEVAVVSVFSVFIVLGIILLLSK